MAASRLGLNDAASGFICTGAGNCCLSHESSRGYRCWIGRSIRDFPARSLAPLRTRSFPVISSSTMPSGHFPLFLSSVLIITTSPIEGIPPPVPALARCLSRRLRMYSVHHRRHIDSLHLSRCFARLRRSAVSTRCGCNSGSR